MQDRELCILGVLSGSGFSTFTCGLTHSEHLNYIIHLTVHNLVIKLVKTSFFIPNEVYMNSNTKGAKLKEADAFVSLMALLCQPYIIDDLPTADHIKLLRRNVEECMDFISFHKLGVSTVRRLLTVKKSTFWDTLDAVAVDNLAVKIKDKIKQLRADSSLSLDDFNFIKDCSLYLRTDSEAALNRIVDKVGRVAPDAARFYAMTATDTAEQEALLAQAKTLIRKMTKISANVLTIEQAAQCRAKYPEDYAKYRKIMLQVSKMTKNVVQSYLRQNGMSKVNDLIAYLDSIGYHHNYTAFDGYIDEKGYYTKFKEPLNGVPTGEILMNPSYKKGSSQYVFKCKARGAKTYQTIYTKGAVAKSRADKFDATVKSVDKINKVRTKWQRDVKANRELGIITELAYLTCARIGTLGNETDGKPTYGLSTLLGKHAKVKGNVLTLTYNGKKGVKQKHNIKADTPITKTIVKWFDNRLDKIGSNDRIFSVNGTMVNKYIRALGLDISVHKFRTLQGTVLMKEQLDLATNKLAKNPSEKSVLEAFKKANTEVAKLLGHYNSTSSGVKLSTATSLKNYIDPSICIAFFDKYEVRLPSILERLK